MTKMRAAALIPAIPAGVQPDLDDDCASCWGRGELAGGGKPVGVTRGGACEMVGAMKLLVGVGSMKAVRVTGVGPELSTNGEGSVGNCGIKREERKLGFVKGLETLVGATVAELVETSGGN